MKITQSIIFICIIIGSTCWSVHTSIQYTEFSESPKRTNLEILPRFSCRWMKMCLTGPLLIRVFILYWFCQWSVIVNNGTAERRRREQHKNNKCALNIQFFHFLVISQFHCNTWERCCVLHVVKVMDDWEEWGIKLYNYPECFSNHKGRRSDWFALPSVLKCQFQPHRKTSQARVKFQLHGPSESRAHSSLWKHQSHPTPVKSR